ncbi:MAG TPA: redoxin domain-containing protein [Dermatophilaceae bacterium]|nr:redoxin domain-containing protein [Dermatophilaceae bacterium]
MPEPSVDQPRVAATHPGPTARLAIVAVTVLLAVGAAVLGTRPPAAEAGGTPTRSAAQEGRPPTVGEPLADFTAGDADGRPVSLAALRGRPVWLTFGASWCAPCRVEAPDLQAAHLAHQGRGLAVVAVYQGESAATVRDFTTTMGLGYLQVPDPDARLTAAYRVVGIPTHVFVDRAGIVRAVDVGVLSPEVVAARVATIGG